MEMPDFTSGSFTHARQGRLPIRHASRVWLYSSTNHNSDVRLEVGMATWLRAKAKLCSMTRSAGGMTRSRAQSRKAASLLAAVKTGHGGTDLLQSLQQAQGCQHCDGTACVRLSPTKFALLLKHCCLEDL